MATLTTVTEVIFPDLLLLSTENRYIQFMTAPFYLLIALFGFLLC